MGAQVVEPIEALVTDCADVSPAAGMCFDVSV